MISSFRLRIALLSALLTGLALLLFGLSSWWLIRNLKLEQIDREVSTQAERVLNRPGRNDDWQGSEFRLLSNLGVRNNTELLLLVQNNNGETRYRSSHWPAGLDVNSLPWPKLHFANSLDFDSALNPEARAMEVTPFERMDRVESARRPGVVQHPRPAFGQGHSQPGEEFPPPPPPASQLFVQTVDGNLWRIALAASNSGRVAVAVDAHVIDDDMRSIRNAFFVALPFTLALIGLGSWIFSSRALRPLQKLTIATRKVTAEGLNQRISGKGEDKEFVELIEVYNRMLERLERSFKQAHRFSADAAHELQTPLAILQGQLERVIVQAGDDSATQAELSSILDEVRRLSTISRKLLLLSQADAGRMNVYREPFDLSKALTELVEDTHMLAPSLHVSGDIQPGIILSADGSLLRQVLHNLISNAIKYNISDGWIRISTNLQPEQIEVLVENTSAGISHAEKEKIFERFYRVDRAHSRHVEGVGLGLSVSREIARAHGGNLILKNSNGERVQFALLLPITVPE